MLLSLAFSLLFATRRLPRANVGRAQCAERVAEATVTRAVTGDSLDARVDGMRTALGYVG